MTWGLRTQGPRASRCSLPPSLYLKTQGRRSSREAGEGWGRAGREARVPRSPALAQQPPEAWPKFTPR